MVGRGLTDYEDLSHRLENDRSLEYVPYVEDLATIYARTRVVVAKIDKSYGFINKVAEALVLGIPVVGDRSAFNGLEAAITAGAGFVADNADDMAARIVELLSDDQAWIAAARAAQDGIGPKLRWEARRAPLEEALASSLNGGRR
jgi:glycosyltransferase involved in cell wall biosynthesis